MTGAKEDRCGLGVCLASEVVVEYFHPVRSRRQCGYFTWNPFVLSYPQFMGHWSLHLQACCWEFCVFTSIVVCICPAPCTLEAEGGGWELSVLGYFCRAQFEHFWLSRKSPIQMYIGALDNNYLPKVQKELGCSPPSAVGRDLPSLWRVGLGPDRKA